MPTTNGRANGDIRRVPDTFKLADWPRNCWYAAAYDVELKRELLARTIAGRKLVLYRQRERRPRRARERVLAPPDAALRGHARGRPGRLRLPRPRLQPRGPLRVHAVAEDDQPGGPRARLSRSSSATASCGCGPGDPALADPDLVPDLHWNDDPEWAGDGKRIHLECGYKLIVDNLMDLTHETFVHGASHRPALDRRGAVRGHPRQQARRRSRAGCATSRRRRSGRMQLEWKHGQAGRQRRPLADHPLRGAEHGRHRRRRRAGRHRRARGRPLRGRQRLRAQHDDPRDRAHLPLLLGLRAQLQPRRPAHHAR